jgi:VanZ family protein
MLVIYVASAQANTAVPDFGRWDLSVKKAGHLLIYAALGLAWQHGLTGGAGRAPTVRQSVLAVVMALLYALSDEFHQSFVPGRDARVLDVGIDTLGAALGVVGSWVWRRMTA